MMRAFVKCSRIFILCLLCLSIVVPIFILSHRLKRNYDASEEYVEDLSIIKHRTETQLLSAIEQEESEGLKEPSLDVYKVDNTTDSIAVKLSFGEFTDDADLLKYNVTRDITTERGQENQEDPLHMDEAKEETHVDGARYDQEVRIMPRKTLDEKIKEMKDQVIRAKAYINFTPVNSSSHFVKELRFRIKDVARAVSQSAKDSRISRSSLQKMKAMESTLLKASRLYPDCAAMVKKLRAMTSNAEEQIRSQRSQESFLKGIGARAIPKGLHCLSMRLTADYFALETKERQLPNQHKLRYPDHYHFAIFSDNILACSVAVNSTISTASEPERIVFHIVTDSINFPAMSMWFLSNPPSKATVDVESIEKFQWLSPKYVTPRKEGFVVPRYTSELNHLRFYLPNIFPHLNKIVLLDHDVVVQKDLTGLWEINMGGKVNGAVHTCTPGEPSFRHMNTFINFTDPIIAKRFNANACTWAFGMNIFDLKQWRRRNIKRVYHNYIRLGNKKPPLWKEGSLPIGWMTFYSETVGLNRRWQALGLGYDTGVKQEDIDNSAVLHYDGIFKPWLDIGLDKYKHYWRKHVNYEHPYLQQCNIH